MKDFKPGSEKLEGIIFDLDGTMINNMAVHHRAWQMTLEKYGLPMTFEEVKQKVHGVNEQILEKLFGESLTSKQRREIALEKEETYRRTFASELALIPGLKRMLGQLIGEKIPIAIASASPPENIDFILDGLSLRPVFRHVFHAGSVRRGKPDPEVFLLAATALGLEPEVCLVFEDSVTGAKASARAGMQSIILTTSHSEIEFSAVDNILEFIPDYTELDIFQYVHKRKY